MSKYLDVNIKRGEIVKQRVHVADYLDNSPVSIPVLTMGGQVDGPTVYIQAGMHGDESTGIEVAQRFVKTLDPAKLRGNLVYVPVANLPSHMTRTRGFLHEERWLMDMNRLWPGRADGLLTERLANIFFEQFVSQADFTIDMHTALDGCDIIPFTYVWPADDTSGTMAERVRLAKAFGAPVYFHKRASKFGTSDVARSLNMQADAIGAKVVLVEMGESRRVAGRFVETGVKGLTNIFRQAGLLEGKPELPANPIELQGFAVVHANRGGGLRVHVDLHEQVKKGQTIAEIVDLFGDSIETIASPRDGMIMRIMRLGSVATGAELAWVAS